MVMVLEAPPTRYPEFRCPVFERYPSYIPLFPRRAVSRPAGARRQAGHSRGNRVNANGIYIRYWNRSRHHQLGAGIRGDPGGRRSLRPGERPSHGDSAAYQSRRSARGGSAAVVSLPSRQLRLSGWISGAALGHEPRFRGGAVGAEARRRECRPAGVIGQELAIAFRCGPHRAAGAVSRSGRRREDFARRGQPALPGAPAPGLGLGASGGSIRRAAGIGDGAGILRCGGARADARSRPTGRLPESHIARRAAGRLLCLDRTPSRLARARAGGRSDPGGGHRRRHHGLHFDRDHRARRRTNARSRGRGRAHSAGRRQHRPGAGGHGFPASRGEGHAHRQPPVADPMEQLPHRERKTAGARLQAPRAAGDDTR